MKRIIEAHAGRMFTETGHLPLAGVNPAIAGRAAETRLSLQAVYTALLTLSSHRADMPQSPERPPRQERGPDLLSSLEQLDRHLHLVLLGDPGSGKSTFVNFVALCLAGEGLGRQDANLEFLRSPLPDDDGSDADIPQALSHGALLPIRVVLRDFAARSRHQASGDSALWAFLSDQLEGWELKEFIPRLRRELLAGRALLLLDGLDEVPEAERRLVAKNDARFSHRVVAPSVVPTTPGSSSSESSSPSGLRAS